MERGKKFEELMADSRKMGLGVRDRNGVIFVSYREITLKKTWSQSLMKNF